MANLAKAKKPTYPPKDPETLVGCEIERIRASHGWTRSDMACQSGVSQRELRYWCQGKVCPQLSTLARFAVSVGLDWEGLMRLNTARFMDQFAAQGTVATLNH